jgi:hypothetical protein
MEVAMEMTMKPSENPQQRRTPGTEFGRKAAGERLQIPGGPIVGKLVGSVAYFPVARSRHFFRIWQSWSLDERLVTTLHGRADTILFDDKETGEAWTASMEAFMKNGRPTRNRTGVKLCLAERYWQPAEQPETCGQLRLFEDSGEAKS